VTSEINDIFPKPSSQGAQSFLNVMAENADEFQNIINPKCSQDERERFSSLLEKLDENYYQLREDFDQAMISMKQEIADLKKNMSDKEVKISTLKEQCAELKASICERDTKICSLESEIATFKANYKLKKQIVSANLMSQNLKLEDKHDTLAKLEEKSNKCF
jgi:chromosome segregation ATPase